MFKTDKTVLRIIAGLLAVIFIIALILQTGCKKKKIDPDKTGNITDAALELKPGDVYASFEFTDYGTVTFKLFPDLAPVGVEKFIELAGRGYYDNKNIHRIIPDQMIQGGSLNLNGSDGRIDEKAMFSVESSGYARNFYGALCFAPYLTEKKNYCQFYIVTQKKSVDIDKIIEQLEGQLKNDKAKLLTKEAKSHYENKLKELKAIPKDVKILYKERGGLYELDGTDTVFGQLIEGRDVLEKINAAQTVAGNDFDDKDGILSKPLKPIIIKTVKVINIPKPEEQTSSEVETDKKGKPVKPKTDKKKSETTAPVSLSPLDELTKTVNIDNTQTAADATVGASG